MNAHKRDLGDKIPFSPVVFALFQLGVLVGCIPGHGSLTKTSLVTSLCWASHHLITKSSTGDFVGDLAIGSAILTQFLIALDNLFFTNPNSLKNLHESHLRLGRIIDQSFSKRVRWAFNLYTNNRGIGWAHEPRVLPKRPIAATPRWKFVLDRLTTAFLGFSLEFLVVVVNASNPGLTTPGKTLSEAPFVWRVLAAAGFALAGRERINALHCILSTFVVGLGLSTPERWPNMFGSLIDAWSVQNVWRVVWHQMLRKPLIACTNFILTNILRLCPSSHKHKANDSNRNKILRTAKWLLWMYTVFFVAGVVHMGGEYMLLGRLGFGAFKFFILQAVGISVEKVAAFISIRLGMARVKSNSTTGRRLLRPSRGTPPPNGSPPNANAHTNTNEAHASKFKSGAKQHHSHHNKNSPRIWVRLIGYLWVIAWFTWTLGFILEPMVSVGMFANSSLDLRKNSWTSIIRSRLRY